jgi:hypothetical protein
LPYRLHVSAIAAIIRSILDKNFNKVSYIRKVKVSRNRPGVAQRVPGGLGSQISKHLAHDGGEVVSLKHRPPLPQEIFLFLIFIRD